VHWRALAQATIRILGDNLVDLMRKEANHHERLKTTHRGCNVHQHRQGSFVVGQLTHAHSAEASATRAFTLRIGDKVLIPSINQVCAVSTEGGAADLFCARPRNAHHQVAIFRDSILVWKVGNPDRPAWAGRP
jgi:hypothetical protein